MDSTYEAITNYLDDKQLEAKDLFIEEYATDPVKTAARQTGGQRVCAGEVMTVPRFLLDLGSSPPLAITTAQAAESL